MKVLLDTSCMHQSTGTNSPIKSTSVVTKDLTSFVKEPFLISLQSLLESEKWMTGTESELQMWRRNMEEQVYSVITDIPCTGPCVLLIRVVFFKWMFTHLPLLDYDWQPWKFGATPRGFWSKEENQKQYMQWLLKELKVNSIGSLTWEFIETLWWMQRTGMLLTGPKFGQWKENLF